MKKNILAFIIFSLFSFLLLGCGNTLEETTADQTNDEFSTESEITYKVTIYHVDGTKEQFIGSAFDFKSSGVIITPIDYNDENAALFSDIPEGSVFISNGTDFKIEYIKESN